MQTMPTTDQLWEIDTRHLAALTAIARTRSVSRAATELNYVQSAVSQQLAALEKVVGQRLVDRGSGPRPVTLTAAGAALLPHAQWILDRLETARIELAGLDSGQRGSIQIGALHSVSARLLPRILASFRTSWPDIAISIRNEAVTEDFLSLVRTGALDVAFIESYRDEPGIEHVELLKDPFVALVPPGHALAGNAVISVAQLGGEDLVAGTLGDSCSSLGEHALRAAGFEPRIVFRTGDNPTRQRLVDAGLGCAIQPALTVEPGLPQGAVSIPLVEDLHRTISLVWSANRTPSFALTSFLRTAETVLAEAGPAQPVDAAAGGKRRRARKAT
jgi:DNA-binding transcriptional LysR family regulator